MARVLGVGGIFYKATDQVALIEWYRDLLGLDMQDWGGAVVTSEAMAAHPGAGTVFSPFAAGTDYMEPSTKAFMINLAVDDLDGVLARCAEHGVTPLKTFPDDFNGRFAHIMDPEGTKIELWQPRPMDSSTLPEG